MTKFFIGNISNENFLRLRKLENALKAINTIQDTFDEVGLGDNNFNCLEREIGLIKDEKETVTTIEFILFKYEQKLFKEINKLYEESTKNIQ